MGHEAFSNAMSPTDGQVSAAEMNLGLSLTAFYVQTASPATEGSLVCIQYMEGNVTLFSVTFKRQPLHPLSEDGLQ